LEALIEVLNRVIDKKQLSLDLSSKTNGIADLDLKKERPVNLNRSS
jgi:hypothetical protein